MCIVKVHRYHLCFPDDIWCRVSSSYSLAFSISSLMRYQLRSLTNYIIRSFFLLLSFKNSFYILDNSPLSDVSFTNIFSQLLTYPLILLTLSFAEQFILMKASSLIMSSLAHAFGVNLEWHHCVQAYSDFLLGFFSKSMLTLQFTFRSVIHFKLVFMKIIKSASRFMIFHVDVVVPA